MKASDYENSIEAHEPATTDDVVADLGVSEGHAQKMLKELAENTPASPVYRERDAHGYVYYVRDSDGGAGTAQGGAAAVEAEGDGRRMPVVRGYDFSNREVERPHEYFSSGGELRRLKARVAGRERSGQPVRGLVGGHTGTGKTTLAQNVASAEQAAWFELNMDADMSDSDMFGSPNLAGDKTLWVDGPVTKAIMASAAPEVQVENGWVPDMDSAHDGPAVLLIDELNRAPAKSKNSLFSVLDHRGRVILDGPRGGEVIQGDPLDLIVIATINEGTEYHGTHRMDHAEVSRWTNRYECDYLASYDKSSETYSGVETEAELLVERRNMPPNVARSMVEVAAEIRAEADDSTNTKIGAGIPTRSVLAWAATAMDYDNAGISNAVVEGAKDTIMSFYSSPGDEDVYDEVLDIVEDSLLGAPLDDAEFESFEADEIMRCSTCGWSVPKPEAESMGAMATLECPDCGASPIKSVRR